MITFLTIIYVMPVNCLFKEFTGISCISCGMTRAFRFILSGDFVSATYTNILSIPLFVFLVYSFIYLILDIIKNENNYINFVLYSIKDIASPTAFWNFPLPYLITYSSGSFAPSNCKILTSHPKLLNISSPLIVAACPAPSES